MIKLYNILPEHVIRPVPILPSNSCVVIYQDLERFRGSVDIDIVKGADIESRADKEAKDFIYEIPLEDIETEFHYDVDIDYIQDGIVISSVYYIDGYYRLGNRLSPRKDFISRFYVIGRNYKFLSQILNLTANKKSNRPFNNSVEVPFSEVQPYLPEE